MHSVARHAAARNAVQRYTSHAHRADASGACKHDSRAACLGAAVTPFQPQRLDHKLEHVALACATQARQKYVAAVDTYKGSLNEEYHISIHVAQRDLEHLCIKKEVLKNKN